MEPGKSGFAHFFEHLMFRGTPTNPPEQIPADHGEGRRARQRGHRRRLHALLLDVREGGPRDDPRPVRGHVPAPSYSEADFKTEARAILGEYNKNSAEPLEKLFEVQRDRFYQAHTYKHTTMGFIRDIENMPNEYAYSKVFFERWYRPQYTTVIIAGDVSPDRVLPLVEKYWGGWKGGRRERRQRFRRSRRRPARSMCTSPGRATRCRG